MQSVFLDSTVGDFKKYQMNAGASTSAANSEWFFMVRASSTASQE